MGKTNNALNQAVEACFAYADSGVSVAGAVKAAFAGVSPAKRDDVRIALYDAIRDRDGRNAEGKLKPARDLSERTAAAYAAARQAFRRLFPGKKAGKKKKGKGKAIIVPLDRKGISKMAKAAISAIQSAESLPYDATRAIAAWMALNEVCGVPVKAK